MKNKGIETFLGISRDSDKTINTIKTSLNKTIEEVILNESTNNLIIHFNDGTGMKISDWGQSCCEHRYMSTDDNLTEYKGSILLGMELKEVINVDGEFGYEHEIKFLDVKTSNGTFQIVNHNEHNGYYGGFDIVAEPIEKTN